MAPYLLKVQRTRPRNPVARDLATPKYHQRRIGDKRVKDPKNAREYFLE